MVGTAPTSTDCVAYWKMESTGNVTDATGNGWTLTNDGATGGSTGKVDNCYHFDGSNDFLNAGTSCASSIAAISVSFWIYPTSSLSDSDRFVSRWGGGEQFLIRYDSSTQKVECYVVGTSGTVGPLYSTSTIGLNAWYHVVMTYDSTSGLKVYVNNDSPTNTAAKGTLTTSVTNSLGVGKYINANTNFFDGLMDEIAIFSVALTADNVTYLYNSGSPGTAQQYPFSSGPIEKTLTSNSSIKVLGTKVTLDSGMFIGYFQSETIASDSTILDTQSKTLLSDSFILKLGTEGSLYSDSVITYITVDETLNSDIFIKKSEIENTLTSISSIKILGTEETLLSDSNIMHTLEETITSDGHILKSGIEENLNSNSFVKKLNTEQTISSDSVILTASTKEETILLDSYILKLGISETLNSESYILKSGTEGSLYSDMLIISGAQVNISSDTYILKSGTEEILYSDSYVKIVDIENSISSDSWISLIVTEILNSDSYVLKETTAPIISSTAFLIETAEHINSDFYVKKLAVEEIITSDIVITYTTYDNTLDSDTFIKKIEEETITSDSEIHVAGLLELTSNSFIKKLANAETITSNSNVFLLSEETITSDAYISLYLRTKFLTSNAVISYEDLSEVMEEGWDELIELPEFEKVVGYKKYNEDTDNITGDRDKSSYNEYSINAEIQPLEITDREVKSGQLQVGDAIGFMPAKIDRTTDDTSVNIRPKINDEITWKGIRYIIRKIIFERIGRIEIFAECELKRIGNENPTTIWNDNYERKYTSPTRPGKGWE